MNAIILKACKTGSSQRYRSAQELRKDLLHLQRGTRALNVRPLFVGCGLALLLAALAGFGWKFRHRIGSGTPERLGDAVLSQSPNTLSREEAAEGFTMLFNGKDLTGWSSAGTNWVVQDGAIKRVTSGGNLVYQTRAIPDNFELRFEWRIDDGTHSAVIYRPGGYNYHIVDNRDPMPRVARKMSAGIYDFIGPSKDKTKPIGEWNEGRVICRGTTVEHWLNGEKVVSFDYASPQWEPLIRSFQQKNRPKFSNRGGNLMLQDRRGAVWFRSIRLREIRPER